MPSLVVADIADTLGLFRALTRGLLARRYLFVPAANDHCSRQCTGQPSARRDVFL